jgi:uncharacterized membrane protein YfcA
MDLSIVVSVAAAFLLAGFVKGIIGMGLPPIAIGVMALVLAPVQAAALILVPSFVTNIWQMTAGPSLAAAARRFGTLQLGLCAGTWFGADVITAMDSKIPSVVLGLALAAYAVLGLTSVRFRVARSREKFYSPVIGVFSGLVMAATGVMVVPLIPYLQAIEIEREELMQALGLTFVVAAVALAVLLFEANLLRPANAMGSALALIPAALGMLAGRHVFKRIDADKFRLCFQIGLLTLGLFIAGKAAFF